MVIVERFFRVVRRDVLIGVGRMLLSVAELRWIVGPRSAYEYDALHRSSSKEPIHNKPS